MQAGACDFPFTSKTEMTHPRVPRLRAGRNSHRGRAFCNRRKNTKLPRSYFKYDSSFLRCSSVSGWKSIFTPGRSAWSFSTSAAAMSDSAMPSCFSFGSDFSVRNASSVKRPSRSFSDSSVLIFANVASNASLRLGTFEGKHGNGGKILASVAILDGEIGKTCECVPITTKHLSCGLANFLFGITALPQLSQREMTGYLVRRTADLYIGPLTPSPPYLSISMLHIPGKARGVHQR